MPWLEATEKIIDIMTSRISTNRMKYVDKNPDDVVAVVGQRMKEEWDASANLEVFELESGGGQVKVTPKGLTTGSHDKSATHLLRAEERWCSCGLWQDSGIPCRHFLVCFRKWRDGIEFRSLLSDSNCIPAFYKYKALQRLYKPNMVPVVVDTIAYDGKTKPPPARVKRQAGRPKVKRYRRRSDFSGPSESPIVCSNCGERGHNRRTCKMEAKKALPLAANDNQNS
jgi:hypothetical protein